MNRFISEAFQEHAVALVLGIEPVDSLRGQGPSRPLRVEIERSGSWAPAEATAPYRAWVGPESSGGRVNRGPTGRYSVLYHAVPPDDAYHPPLGPAVDLRIYDGARHVVPRRLRIPLLTRPQAEEATRPLEHRVRRPAVFPGAAYPLSRGATGLRGRILRHGEAMRWAWVEARFEPTDTVVGNARSDDRGEFLLVISPEASPFDSLTAPLPIRVTVSGPAVVPTPATPILPARDPWWDLPLEEAPVPGAPDTVSPGTITPPGFVSTLSASRIIDFELARMLSGADVGDFVFE